MATTIVNKDHGYARLVKAVSEKLPPVSVGVLTNEVHEDSDLTVAEIGEIHELGLGVPARPWLRPVVDGRKAFFRDRLRRVAAWTLQGKITAAVGMDQFGREMVRIVQTRIRAGIPPELAESTKKRKGANKNIPLIHTAQFIGSISHRVGT